MHVHVLHELEQPHELPMPEQLRLMPLRLMLQLPSCELQLGSSTESLDELDGPVVINAAGSND